MTEKTLKGYLVTFTFDEDDDASPEKDSPGQSLPHGESVEDLFEMTYFDDDGESVLYRAYPMSTGGWRKAVQDQLEAFKTDPAYPDKDMVKVGLFTPQDVVHVLGIMQAEIFAEVDRLYDYAHGHRGYWQVGVRYDAVYQDGTVEKGETHWMGGLTFDESVDWGFLEHCALAEHAPEGCPPLDWDRIRNNWCTYLGEGEDDHWGSIMMWLSLDGTIAKGVVEMMDPCDSGTEPFQDVPEWEWISVDSLESKIETEFLAYCGYYYGWPDEPLDANRQDYLTREVQSKLQWVLNQTNLREKSDE